MDYGIAAYAVGEALWEAMRTGADWLREPGRQAAEEARRRLCNTALATGVSRAIEQMVQASEFDEDFTHYGYGLELLAGRCGFALRSEFWTELSRPTETISRVSKGLAEAGAPAASALVGSVIYGSPPITLPDNGDFPGIGYLPREEIASAVEVFNGVDPSALDPEISGGVEEIRLWLLTCQTMDDKDLLCFLRIPG